MPVGGDCGRGLRCGCLVFVPAIPLNRMSYLKRAREKASARAANAQIGANGVNYGARWCEPQPYQADVPAAGALQMRNFIRYAATVSLLTAGCDRPIRLLVR